MSKKKEEQDPRLAMALCRYEVISGYLVLKPRRGLKKKLLEKLAKETWRNPDGEPMTVAAETIRSWARRYRRSGLQGLMDKERERRGVEVLTEEQKELICSLKKDVPERSIDRIIKIAEDTELIEQGIFRRSTVHRVLQSKGLSKRNGKTSDIQDLDRFEADNPNDLWQSDMLHGPLLPDPARPGKTRTAKLYLFMDDHSRFVLHGRFSFNEDLPHLELVFRRALQKNGVPNKVYYDNGKVYRSGHMKQIVAELGMHGIIHTKPYRPQGHGKIEKLNGLIRSNFIAELKASKITTLDELNEAFLAWVQLEYNEQKHSETGENPRIRWERGIENVTFADEEKLREAFMWKETRTADKTGVFKLLGTKYQVGPGHGGKRLQIRFDPEALHEVEVLSNGKLLQRAKPLTITANRRPKPKDTISNADQDVIKSQKQAKTEPVVDYMQHLVEERRASGIYEPSPQKLKQDIQEKREQNTQSMISLLDYKLQEGVVDIDSIRKFMNTYGPIDIDMAELALDELFESGMPNDLPVSSYLGNILKYVRGKAK